MEITEKDNFQNEPLICLNMIVKNESKIIKQTLEKLLKKININYWVISDTGSTDGTYERLKTVPNLILEQKTFNPFNFSEARNYCLGLIPKDTEWCLSPDMDEYFSINTLEEVEQTVKHLPQISNISYDRLDIRSKRVRVGPPGEISSNKIHKYGVFKWVYPVYEHINYTGDGECLEYYNQNIFLIHDQDPEVQRENNYLEIMIREYKENPSNDWNLWYLLQYYHRNNNLTNFIEIGCDFIKYSPKNEKRNKIALIFENLIANDPTILNELKVKMFYGISEHSKT
jgi:hypothetical protein